MRLKLARVEDILGFNVPQLLGHDDESSLIQMTVVERPFVLDFAGAYLDVPPVVLRWSIRQEYSER